MTTPLPAHEIDTVQPDQLDELCEFLDGVFRHSHGIRDQNMRTDYPLVYHPDTCHNSKIIQHDGRIISHAAIWPRELIVADQRLKSGVIVSVATDTAHRQRGHAAALMRDLQQTLQADEFDFGHLWTTVPGFYARLGWESIQPQGAIVDVGRRGIEQVSTRGYEIMPLDPDSQLESVLALFAQQPVRFSRTYDEARLLYCLPKVAVWVAVADGAVQGYLVHGQAHNKHGICEYAGATEVVVALIEHVAAHDTGDSPIPMLVYHTRPDLQDWARAEGLSVRELPSSKGIGKEMVYVVNPERFTAEIREQLFVWGLDHA